MVAVSDELADVGAVNTFAVSTSAPALTPAGFTLPAPFNVTTTYARFQVWVPGNGYDQLDGVQAGGDAQAVYLRVAAPEALRRDMGYTEQEHQQERQQMLKYCEHDTEAMTLILRELLKKP